MITTIAILVSVGMAVLAPQIVAALYGPRWAVAAGPLSVLALFSGFRAIWLLNGYFYNAIGRPDIDFSMNAARLVVMGALLYPLTSAYGLVGAAFAVTVPMALQFVGGVYLSRRFINAPMSVALGPLLSTTMKAVVLAVVLLGARSALTSDARIALPCLIAVAGATCVALNHREIRTLYVAVGAR